VNSYAGMKENQTGSIGVKANRCVQTDHVYTIHISSRFKENLNDASMTIHCSFIEWISMELPESGNHDWRKKKWTRTRAYKQEWGEFEDSQRGKLSVRIRSFKKFIDACTHALINSLNLVVYSSLKITFDNGKEMQKVRHKFQV